ncbi:cell division topological specificity factor MinE [Methylobacterium durans]|uniref:Cell division topological specificity factor n=1 Tax=Methylobacterium durans TaxID=2202825 RepID=A0A2U8W4C4_9HYPH|nr:cell division topological specificity factor MinE [Methylobacterium durans]AWN40488.1 cell division topological specificity factor MinE [Methylobacterium durans]
MSLLSLFSRRGSAPVARERLQLIIAHERADNGRSDLVVTLREEILAVIAKHAAIERDKVSIKAEQREGVSTLDINIELPTIAVGMRKAA